MTDRFNSRLQQEWNMLTAWARERRRSDETNERDVCDETNERDVCDEINEPDEPETDHGLNIEAETEAIQRALDEFENCGSGSDEDENSEPA